MDPTFVSTLAAALTAATGFYIAISTSRKNNAEAAKDMIDAALEISNNKDSLTIMKLYIEYLQTGILVLIIQLAKLNQDALFTPKSLDKFTNENQKTPN